MSARTTWAWPRRRMMRYHAQFALRGCKRPDNNHKCTAHCYAAHPLHIPEWLALRFANNSNATIWGAYLIVQTCTLPRVRAPTIWFPDSLMTTMQATPSNKMAFYTLSAANAMNNTKALHLAPVPDSMLMGEVGSCSVWPTTDQGARGPPQARASCCLECSVQTRYNCNTCTSASLSENKIQ